MSFISLREFSSVTGLLRVFIVNESLVCRLIFVHQLNGALFSINMGNVISLLNVKSNSFHSIKSAWLQDTVILHIVRFDITSCYVICIYASDFGL